MTDIERLQALGKIRGYKDRGAPKSGDLLVNGETPARPDGAKTKARFKAQIALFCTVYRMTHLQEQVFHPTRKWRFDHVVTGPRGPVALEYEGIFNGESRHTHVTGYEEDAAKYRAATLAGIPYLRYTAISIMTVFSDLEKLFKLNAI